MASVSDVSWAEGARFAIYAAPPADSALARFGHGWLGYDADSGKTLAPPPLRNLSAERWDTLTRRARVYGFHGTFKPPFALAEGRTYGELDGELAALAEQYRAFEVPLRLQRIAGFLALTPAQDTPALHRLADACVERFDGFRRPETPEQIAGRRAGLTPKQSALLDRWGYPYVFEEFRFHMTLTDRVSDAEAEDVTADIESFAGPVLDEPLALDTLALFAQPARGQPFKIIRRYALKS